jgi:CBS domain-containing protein
MLYAAAGGLVDPSSNEREIRFDRGAANRDSPGIDFRLRSGEVAMLTAGSIMTPNLVTIRPEASIEEAIETLLEQQISGVPVVDGTGRLVGVITEFALLAVAYDHRVKNHTVAQHMTREVITADINDSLSHIADLCILHRVRRVPVLQDGRLVGLIARRDVLRSLADSPITACTA